MVTQYFDYKDTKGKTHDKGYREASVLTTFFKGAKTYDTGDFTFKSRRFDAERVDLTFDKAMITMAFPGAGNSRGRRNYVLGEAFPKIKDQPLADDPCFMMAYQKQGHWWLSRYVGQQHDDGSFSGKSTTVVAGLATRYMEDRLAAELAIWMRQQDNRGKSFTPDLFQQAQRVNPYYGIAPRNDDERSRPAPRYL